MGAVSNISHSYLGYSIDTHLQRGSPIKFIGAFFIIDAAVNMKEEEFKGWSEKIIATGLDNLEAWADELGN